jgi:translation initiation factor 2 beta subunit (eIF-2beta)/eIF-5
MPRIPIPNNEKTSVDPNYRYQRDTLIISKSGQYSVMDNLDQICKQLMIDDKSDIINFIPKYLKQSVKMIGNKVGAKVNSDDSLEDMLEYYIIKNVICSNCSLPEINMNKCSERYMTCNSCGQDKFNQVKSDHKQSDHKQSDQKQLNMSISSKVKKSTKELKKDAIIAKKQAILEARKSKSIKKSDSDSESESESESDLNIDSVLDQEVSNLKLDKISEKI